MGKVNENNPAFKLKQEMGVAKSRVVKLKVLVDNELADSIEFILANSKRATDIEPSEPTAQLNHKNTPINSQFNGIKSTFRVQFLI